jgi:hypothetical protein
MSGISSIGDDRSPTPDIPISAATAAHSYQVVNLQDKKLEQKPFYKEKWFKVALAVVAVAAAAIVTIAIVAAVANPVGGSIAGSLLAAFLAKKLVLIIVASSGGVVASISAIATKFFSKKANPFQKTIDDLVRSFRSSEEVTTLFNRLVISVHQKNQTFSLEIDSSKFERKDSKLPLKEYRLGDQTIQIPQLFFQDYLSRKHKTSIALEDKKSLSISNHQDAENYILETKSYVDEKFPSLSDKDKEKIFQTILFFSTQDLVNSSSTIATAIHLHFLGTLQENAPKLTTINSMNITLSTTDNREPIIQIRLSLDSTFSASLKGAEHEIGKAHTEATFSFTIPLDKTEAFEKKSVHFNPVTVTFS